MHKTLLSLLLCIWAFAVAPASAAQTDAASAVDQGSGKLIELSVLEGMANGPNADKAVTVLLSLQRADATSASSSVSRTFERNHMPKMAPDSRANAVFISGSAAVVQEAVTRLRALDEATPEKPTRSYRPQSPEEIAIDAVDASSGPDMPGMQFSLAAIAGGIAVLAIFVALVVRRPFR